MKADVAEFRAWIETLTENELIDLRFELYTRHEIADRASYVAEFTETAVSMVHTLERRHRLRRILRDAVTYAHARDDLMPADPDVAVDAVFELTGALRQLGNSDDDGKAFTEALAVVDAALKVARSSTSHEPGKETQPMAEMETELEQIRVELAEIKARQAASEAVKDRLPAPVSTKRVLFHNQLAESQERARVARCRAAELAHLEAEGVARRDQPRRDKVMKRLAPVEQRMAAIFREQQALELELQELGRRRIALATEMNPPKPVPVAVIGMLPEDKFIRANGTMRRVRA